MDIARLTALALWLGLFSSFASIAGAGGPEKTAELKRLLAATATKIPLPKEAWNLPEDAGIVRLYQVRSEVQLAGSKITHSDSAAFVIRLSVDGDLVVLHNDHANARYKINGRRFVYQSEEGQEGMQVSAPAIVAARLDQGRVEILTVTPKRLTILQSLHAEEGYRLTTAEFVGEKPLAEIDRPTPKQKDALPPNQP